MVDTQSTPPGRRRLVAAVVLAFPVVVGLATVGISDGWLGPDAVRIDGEGDGVVPTLPGGPQLDGLVGLSAPGPVQLVGLGGPTGPDASPATPVAGSPGTVATPSGPTPSGPTPSGLTTPTGVDTASGDDAPFVPVGGGDDAPGR